MISVEVSMLDSDDPAIVSLPGVPRRGDLIIVPTGEYSGTLVEVAEIIWLDSQNRVLVRIES